MRGRSGIPVALNRFPAICNVVGLNPECAFTLTEAASNCGREDCPCAAIAITNTIMRSLFVDFTLGNVRFQSLVGSIRLSCIREYLSQRQRGQLIHRNTGDVAGICGHRLELTNRMNKSVPITRAFSFTTAVVCFLFVFLIALLQPIEAAYPWLLMISGMQLKQPIVVQDGKDIVSIIHATLDALDSSALNHRPYFELTLFWGDVWSRYLKEGKPVNALKPEDVTPFANVPIRGRLYPACKDAPARITLTTPNTEKMWDTWVISPDGLKVLEKLGVPVTSDCN